jgi:hypothetical protein
VKAASLERATCDVPGRADRRLAVGTLTEIATVWNRESIADDRRPASAYAPAG